MEEMNGKGETKKKKMLSEKEMRRKEEKGKSEQRK